MNYYNYLKKQIDSNYNLIKNKKKIKLLVILIWSNIFLDIIFSSFFIAYFVKLANYVRLSFEVKKTNTWIQEQVIINNALLVCMCVFWILFISFFLWQFWTLLSFKILFNKFNDEYEYKKYFIYVWIFGVLGLFMCLIGIISLSLQLNYLMNLKKYLMHTENKIKN